MTYGLIGTVFGYVIGQGVGTALLKLGWLGQRHAQLLRHQRDADDGPDPVHRAA
jgi:hypothetical protein